MTVSEKTYHVMPVMVSQLPGPSFTIINARNSKEAAQKAISLYDISVKAFLVWSPVNRNCEHVYRVKHIKDPWNGIPFGD